MMRDLRIIISDTDKSLAQAAAGRNNDVAMLCVGVCYMMCKMLANVLLEFKADANADAW